ncbi:MAG: DUF2247 family protein [Flavobacteriales bacterium]
MYEFIKNEKFRLTWDIIYYALKYNILPYNKIWNYYVDITENEVDKNNSISEKIMLYEEDIDDFLDFLGNNFILSKGKEFWEFIYLYQVYKNKDLELQEKLKKIEYIWADYGYSEELKNFIYYMPNKVTNSVEEVYKLFKQYIINKKPKFCIQEKI